MQPVTEHTVQAAPRGADASPWRWAALTVYLAAAAALCAPTVGGLDPWTRLGRGLPVGVAVLAVVATMRWNGRLDGRDPVRWRDAVASPFTVAVALGLAVLSLVGRELTVEILG
jgi:hypothetical protein